MPVSNTTPAAAAEREEAPNLSVGEQFRVHYPDQLRSDRWLLTIVSREGQNFRGIFAQQTGWGAASPTMPGNLAFRVTGTIDADRQIEFEVSKYDLYQNNFLPLYTAQGKLDRAGFLTYQGKSENARLFLEVTEPIAPQLAVEMDQNHSAAVTRGHAEFMKKRQTIEQLQRQGHGLHLTGLLDDGRLDLMWSDYVSATIEVGDEVYERPEGYLEDHQILADLAPLKHINYISLSRIDSEQDLALLSHLEEIDFLRINRHTGLTRSEQLSGDELRALATDTKIHHLELEYVSDIALEHIAKIPELHGLEIRIKKESTNSVLRADMLSYLLKAKQLKSLKITYAKNSLDGGWAYLAGHPSLEELSIPLTPTRDDIRAIRDYPQLKQLAAGNMTIDQLRSLKSDSLESISVGKQDDFSEERLADWVPPPNLQHLSFNYWTPEPNLDYFQRLPKMPVQERVLYSAVRMLKEAYYDYRNTDFSYQRELLPILGGMRRSAVRDVDRPSVLGETIEAYQQIENSRRGYEKVMASLSREMQSALSDMLQSEQIPRHAAKSVQYELFRFTGKLLPELEAEFDPLQKEKMAENRQAYLNEKKYKRSQ